MEELGAVTGAAGGQTEVTPALLKATTGEFSLESILLLRLRGRGIAHLGCLADCSNLEWLDLSDNAIAGLAPLATLRALAVLNLAGNRVASVEPLRGCRSLRQLNLGLRHLESLRLRDPLGNLGNPLCAAPHTALAPGRHCCPASRPSMAARGWPRSELFRLCRELMPRWTRRHACRARGAAAAVGAGWILGATAAAPQRCAGGGHAAAGPGPARVPRARPPRDDSIAQAQRALGRRHHGNFGF
uniref:Leucine-rich repeat-containing protein 61 n=1 Tax=Malurus cyaneus samueli TaxID=2593467 RepID=A0A8C5X4G2_9PASS